MLQLARTCDICGSIIAHTGFGDPEERVDKRVCFNQERKEWEFTQAEAPEGPDVCKHCAGVVATALADLNSRFEYLKKKDVG